MSIPGNSTSTTPVVADYLSPDDSVTGPLGDHEQGGKAIGDVSEGLSYQKWTASYHNSDVIITPATFGSPVILFNKPDIIELGIAFDQLMNPFVAYTIGSVVWYWWFDPTVPGQVHSQLPAGASSPRCCMDDKRVSQVGVSDIIFAYIRSSNLYFRQQRDRYTVEYLFASTVVGTLETIGMNKFNRLQFALVADA